MTDRTVEIANKIKEIWQYNNEPISDEYADYMAKSVRELTEVGIPEDRIMDILGRAITLENPELYIDSAIISAYCEAMTRGKS